MPTKIQFTEREKKTRAKSMLICSFDEMTRDNFITVYFTKNNCVFFVVFFCTALLYAQMVQIKS